MAEGQQKARLDAVLVSRGFFSSRSRARDAILRQTIAIEGVIAQKPGLLVVSDVKIEVKDPAQKYVSRAALKLKGALDKFQLDIKGVRAADIGASTGGFTQVLLENGAQCVTAIDVGQGQLHSSLQDDARVKVYEKLNARTLSLEHFTHNGALLRPNFIVSDVSFISLKLALPPVLEIAETGARTVLLIKPQFEVGRENIGKNGALKDSAQAEEVAQDLFSWLDNLPNWHACGLAPSPIVGGEGAKEFLLYGEKD